MTTERQGVRTIDPLDLRNLIEAMTGLVACALPDGSVELVNRAWQEYTGCSLQQLSGWVWQSAIHPDDVARFIDELTIALADTKPFQSEARIRRADGRYHWFLIRKALARYPNPRPRIIPAYVDRLRRTLKNVNEAEAKLQQSEALLQAFFENSPNLTFVKDPQGRYLYANKAI